MVLQLVRNIATGAYEYKDAMETTAPKINTTDFEAYEKKQDTKLAGDTNIGAQTEQLIRETPGEYTTTFNEQTGQFETKTKGGEITNIPFQAPTGVTPSGPTETALDKVQRITAATQPSSPVDFRGEIMTMQDKALKAQRINTLIKGGFDLGAAYLRYGTGQGTAMNFMPTTQLTQVAATPIGASTLGGVGTAGAIGYGAGKLIGAKESEARGMGAGAAIGTAVGGPIGGVIGGAIGGIVGCFLPNTEITMANGSKKKIIDIELKDNIKVGGNVFATAKFLVTNLYDYKGVKVSGSHMVNENNKWIRVEDSDIAKSLGNDEHVVYTLGTQNRRIVINDILFTDYFEIDEKEELVKQGDSYFDTWKLHSDYLSQQNVYKINEKQTLELR